MVNTLVINSSANETRVALLENSSVAEVYLERSDSSSGMVGNIYKGKVVRIIPGIQAAFIDLGFERSAFLYVNDVMSGVKDRGRGSLGEHSHHPPVPGGDLEESLGELDHGVAIGEDDDGDDDCLVDPDCDGDEDEDHDHNHQSLDGDDEDDDELGLGDEEHGDGEGDAPYCHCRARGEDISLFNRGGFHDRGFVADPLKTEKMLLHTPGEAIQIGSRGQSAGFRKSSIPIEQLLRPGQEILVQVAKAPMGSKGARVTTHITLPGRLVVLLPFSHQIRVSRRISDDKERSRLRKILEEAGGGQFGIIARTAAGGRSEAELQGDVTFLSHLHDKVVKRFSEARAPSLLHGDLDLPMRMIRDLHASLGKIVIDSVDMYERVKKFMTNALPKWTGSLEFHDRPEPVFDHFGIEIELKRALCRKVWLRSGGYLVIDETEALCAIDVNTGRFVGRRKVEDTILQTNMEAVKEIVHQLRLRNVGGLIIIDFIDMEQEESRRLVVSALEEALKADRAKTNVSQISPLGLVEMTRKRVQESLRQGMTEICFYCEGRGFIKSKRTVCLEILREVRRVARRGDDQCIVVHAHPRVIDSLFIGEDRMALEDVEQKLARQVMLMPARTFHIEEFRVSTVSPKQMVGDMLCVGGSGDPVQGEKIDGGGSGSPQSGG